MKPDNWVSRWRTGLQGGWVSSRKLCSQSLQPLRKVKEPEPPVYGDLAKRPYTAPSTDLLWTAEITENWAKKGNLYLCAIQDASSRRIVGFSSWNRTEARLTATTLLYAVARRSDVSGGIVHSGRDSQFRCWYLITSLGCRRLEGFLGRVGAAGANTAIQSAFELNQKNVPNRPL